MTVVDELGGGLYLNRQSCLLEQYGKLTVFVVQGSLRRFKEKIVVVDNALSWWLSEDWVKGKVGMVRW